VKGSIKKNNKTGKWDFVIDIGNDSITGKRKQKRRRGFASKKAAETALIQLKNESLQGTYIEPTQQKYCDYFNEWLSGKAHNISSQTLQNYKSYFSKHINSVFGQVPLSKINPLLVQKFITTLREKKLSDSTIKRIFSVVNTSLNNAVKMELIAKNPASVIEKPAVKVKEMKIWDIEEVTNFLQKSKNSPYYIAFLLAITTGMRQGEILGLRWKDVDLDGGVLYVKQTLSHDGKTFKAGAKSKAGNRTIGIDDYTISALKQHRKIIAQNQLKYGISFQKNDLVICTPKGTPVNPRNLLRAFYNLMDNNHIPKIRFHDLRHTHSSLMLKQGENIKLISERLGHSNVRITLDTYSHVMPNMQKEASNRLSNKLFGNDSI
jgi:integrase